jgi:hypothetical protein
MKSQVITTTSTYHMFVYKKTHNVFKTFNYLYTNHTGTPCRKYASAQLNSQAQKWLYIEVDMYIYECKMAGPMQQIQNLAKLEVSFL